jgi:hypothetical protein
MERIILIASYLANFADKGIFEVKILIQAVFFR